jgi:hypothetical protein
MAHRQAEPALLMALIAVMVCTAIAELAEVLRGQGKYIK